MEAHTQQLLKNTEGVSQEEVEEWKERVASRNRNEKKYKEHRPSSELPSAPFRFVPHYYSVLSQAWQKWIMPQKEKNNQPIPLINMCISTHGRARK